MAGRSEGDDGACIEKRYNKYQIINSAYFKIPLPHTISLMLTLWTLSNLRLLLLLLVLLILHPLHDPSARLLGIIVRSLLVLHDLLHLAEVIRHIHTLVNSGTLLNRLQPGLDLRETAGLDTGPLAPVDCKKSH